MEDLKMFVWESVLTDYTSGMVCILAHDEEEAWELLKAKDSTAWWVLNGEPEDRSYKGITLTATRPRIIERPEAFVVWGGG